MIVIPFFSYSISDGLEKSSVFLFRKASLNKIGKSTKQDIKELGPSLSISSIEGSLRKMIGAGELKREGSGKSTFYYRLK